MWGPTRLSVSSFPSRAPTLPGGCAPTEVGEVITQLIVLSPGGGGAGSVAAAKEIVEFGLDTRSGVRFSIDSDGRSSMIRRAEPWRTKRHGGDRRGRRVRRLKGRKHGSEEEEGEPRKEEEWW